MGLFNAKIHNENRRYIHRLIYQLSPKLRQESKSTTALMAMSSTSADWKSYTKVTRAIVRDFLFADDCALAAHSEVDLQELADCFATAAKSFGLTVSIKKTEVLRRLAPNTARPPPNITMDGNALKNVDTFKYLGSCINSAANLDDEALCRISWAKPGIWAPPHTSMAWAGHLDQDQAERIPSCCATISPVRLRDLDLLQAAIPRNWTSFTCVAFAKFSVSAGRTMCQTRRSFAGLSSLALKPC